MKAYLITGAALAVLAAPACAQEAATYEDKTPAANVQDSVASDLKVSFGLTGATDYVWRGVSQSNSDPTVFATANLAYKGFYAGVGTENVSFLGIDQEYDLWAGYVANLGAVALDVGVVRYGYVDAPVPIDTLEGKVALSGNAGNLGLKASAYYTGNFFGSKRDAWYGEVAASYPLTDKLTLSGAYGHQQVVGLRNHETWNLGASYAVLPGASVSVRYHDTAGLGSARNVKGRVVGSFSVSF